MDKGTTQTRRSSLLFFFNNRRANLLTDSDKSKKPYDLVRCQISEKRMLAHWQKECGEPSKL